MAHIGKFAVAFFLAAIFFEAEVSIGKMLTDAKTAVLPAADLINFRLEILDAVSSAILLDCFFITRSFDKHI